MDNKNLQMNKIIFKSKKEVTEFLKEKGIDTSNWTEEKWQSINQSQAEIHMQALAEAMWDAMNESTPKQLKSGEWHLPFSDKINDSKLAQSISPNKALIYNNLTLEDLRLKVCTSRCARLSYMTFDGEIDYEKDIQLHDRLLADKHMSPFEHCARAMSDLEYFAFVKGEYPTVEDSIGIVNYELYPKVAVGLFEQMGYEGINPKNPDIYGWCNNFKGFIPYRYLIENKY